MWPGYPVPWPGRARSKPKPGGHGTCRWSPSHTAAWSQPVTCQGLGILPASRHTLAPAQEFRQAFGLWALGSWPTLDHRFLKAHLSRGPRRGGCGQKAPPGTDAVAAVPTDSVSQGWQRNSSVYNKESHVEWRVRSWRPG